MKNSVEKKKIWMSYEYSAITTHLIEAHSNTNSDITGSCCGYHFFLPWNFTKELKENGHFLQRNFHSHFPIIPNVKLTFCNIIH